MLSRCFAWQQALTYVKGQHAREESGMSPVAVQEHQTPEKDQCRQTIAYGHITRLCTQVAVIIIGYIRTLRVVVTIIPNQSAAI